ncbi:MAG TPA: phosphoribosylglycinamide formyltransferase [Tepidisphaeraceae bacterium]|jgi:formyltetrahydrofolate-dependent phosphoribosylglycinamide formyltransferase|nr:phosphoribosylglycinamide formyltransferase [Tepidisphaeraceae bacterium]
MKLAVLASGSGTTLQNLIDRVNSKSLDARIDIVIASRPNILALDRAAKAAIPAHIIDRKSFSNAADFSKPIFKLIDEQNLDLVCLAGWLCMLNIPPRYAGRVMNIHPALLPSFGGPGMYGRKVHEAVLAHGCKVSGCTVHFVDEKYDNGPIIMQRVCPVLENDTPESLAHRVFEEEKIAYPQAIRLFQQGRLKIHGRRVQILSESIT